MQKLRFCSVGQYCCLVSLEKDPGSTLRSQSVILALNLTISIHRCASEKISERNSFHYRTLDFIKLNWMDDVLTKLLHESHW